MTIEERNNKLKHFITCLKCEVSGKCCDDNCSTQYDAGNMGEIIENLEAISKALEQESTAKNDLVLIHTEGLDEGIRCAMCTNYMKSDRGCDGNCIVNKDMYKAVMDVIKKSIQPSVTPQEPKTGHWIDIMVGDMPAQACDRCNTFYPLAYTGGGHNYCPNCGARMVEPQESEET